MAKTICISDTYYTILYKGCEHLQIFISSEALGPIFIVIEGITYLEMWHLGKSHHQIPRH